MLIDTKSAARSSESWHSRLWYGVWALPILLFVSLCGWALSSPVGSSPDDDFHLASIWCGQGERAGLCEAGETAEQRQVPIAILQAPCFAFNPQLSGECQNGSSEIPANELGTVTHGNWNGSVYPPLFYSTMSIFAGENVAISVVAMRLANALLATILLSLTAFALPRKLKPAFALSAALSFVPLGLSIIPSTNPSSWALLSAAIVFPTVLALAETTGRRRWLLFALAASGVVLGAGARADAAVFAAFAAVVAWFLAEKKQRLITITAAVIVALCAIAFLGAGQSGALGGLSANDGSSASGISLLIFNLTQLPSMWLGMFTNLGWLDTVVSPLALFGVVFPVLGVLFATLGTLTWRKGIAMLVVFAAISLVPLYMLQASNAAVGSQVQPRYILPLLTILIAVSLTPTPRALQLTLVQLITIAGLLAGAFSLSLYDQLTRYVAGERIINLDNGGWWWSGVGIGPMSTLVIASLSCAMMLALFVAIHNRSKSVEDAPAGDA